MKEQTEAGGRERGREGRREEGGREGEGRNRRKGGTS